MMYSNNNTLTFHKYLNEFRIYTDQCILRRVQERYIVVYNMILYLRRSLPTAFIRTGRNMSVAKCDQSIDRSSDFIYHRQIHIYIYIHDIRIYIYI
jgi:hypothetical protein